MRVYVPVAVVVALASPAMAQDIVVTADRESLARAGPASISVLTATEIAVLTPQVASDALNTLPGVSIQRNNGVENLLAIRSPVLTGGQSAGSFLVLENGVPVRAPGAANVNQIWEASLDFAERITLVRGPGSSIYGSNAVHGLINVETPAFSDGSNNNTGHWRRGNLDVSDLGRSSASILLGAATSTSLGPSSTTGLPNDQTGPANSWVLGLATEVDSGWRAQSGLSRADLAFGWRGNLAGWGATAHLSAQNLNQESAGFIEGARAYANSALARSNPAPEAYRDTRLARASIRLEASPGAWQVALTPYARWIDTDLNLFFFPSRAQERTRQTGGGLLTSASLALSPSAALTIGADIDQTRAELVEFQSRPTTGTFTQGTHYDFAVDMLAAGSYAQLQWGLAEDIVLTAGVRGEVVQYEYDNRAPNGDVGRFRRPADRGDRFEALAPRLAVSYASPFGALWVNLARGARPPQITDLYALQTRQRPGEQGIETLDSIELGWRPGAQNWQGEVVVFAMDKQDTAFRGADGFTVTGGRSRHKGVEVTGSAQISQSLMVSGWLSYARHTYRFNSAPDGIRSGADIDTAPRWTGNARARWQATEHATLDLEWGHTGRYFTDAGNTRVYEGHDLFTLRAATQIASDVQVYATVRNLTNTNYADRADFAFGNDRYFPGAPRSLTVGIRMNR
ncbi:MAG: TonB-dependent receptor [Caulobacterales bacterium]